MRHRSLTFVAGLAALSLTAAACGSDDAGPDTTAASTEDSMVDEMTEDAMVDEMTEDAMVDEMTEDSMVDEMTEDSMVDEMTEDSMVDDMTDEDGAALAPWQTLPITDVDGATFTLGDLVGTPVLVETFATWCPKCRSQLGETNALAEQAGDAASVVALSVETDLSSADVADYAADNGFTSVRFAVVSPELLAALVEAYGPTVANPPATPKIAIDAMGHAGELTTGAESVESMAMRLGLGG